MVLGLGGVVLGLGLGLALGSGVVRLLRRGVSGVEFVGGGGGGKEGEESSADKVVLKTGALVEMLEGFGDCRSSSIVRVGVGG